MAQVIINIGNREYSIACEDGQEGRILQLARMLDDKAKSLGASSGQVSENMLLAMIGLLLADELAEAKKGTLATSTTQSDFKSLDIQLSENIKKLTLLLKKDLQ